MEKIAHRRKKLILKRRMAKYPEREREKIDCAVDLLKESLKIAPYFCIKSVSQSSVHIQEVSNPLIKAIAVCQDKNAIWNIDLEDVFVVLDNYGNRKGTCFLGLFDGSNGISAARTASAELPLLLLDQLSHGDLSYQVSQAEKEVLDSFRTVFRADYIVREKIFTFKRVQSKKTQQNKYEWIHRAYAKSFWRMDQLLCLGRNEVSRVRWSSCAAAICLVEKINNKQIADNKEIKEGSLLENNTSSDEVSVGLMHIANIGNVHAVLCKNGKSYWLTKEHSTYSREEKIRVFRKGGYISSNEPKGLLEGLTKNTRGLGFHGNRKLKRSVIPVPHTISFPIDDSCQFLVLASNGLWEVLDKSEVVLLTLTMFSAYLEKYQDAQLKKRHSSSDSELPLDDLEDQNLSQSNAQLSPAKHSISEKAIIKSDSFKENSVEESVSSLESTLSSITSSSEDTETLPPRSGSEEILDQNTELALESDDSSQTSEDTETNSRTFYDLAAKYISKHLVKAALKAGSRDNITVLVALLNGCDKIPIYHHLLLF
uniref:Protein phosphatase 2C like domain containing 1 n=1 Tax=Varanus komodoensis TaxID=61221 RepID=A0A8D2J5R3_VARKO